MRIAAVEIRGHPGLGDLDVDLRGADGRAARLVVVAGENGCGKTALLEAIFAALAPSNLLMSNPLRLAPGHYRILIELDTLSFSTSFQIAISPETLHEIRNRWTGFNGIVVEVNGDEVRSGRSHHKYHLLFNNSSITGAHNSVEVLGGAYSCFYSEANVSFEVPKVETIRTSAGEGQQRNVAPNVAFPVRGGPALAGEVAQLLVDLQAADNADVARWLDENEGRPPDEVRKRRIKRFTDAFARVVPHKRYQGVVTVDGEHRAIFEENGFRTALADLSTGEKQIIFRGAFLLRQAERLPGAVVLIDEPELSLHPAWQSGILPFYEGIVTELPGKTSQIIVATHSPFVVHGSPTAKHIVLRRDRSTGLVRVDSEPVYPGVTAAEMAVAAFDLGKFAQAVRGRRLALVVEGPSDQAILETAWRKLRPGRKMPFVLMAAGSARGIQQLLGSSELGKPGPLLGALRTVGVDCVVGIFDFDGEGFGHWNGTVKSEHAEENLADIARGASRKRRSVGVWVALLPVPPHRIRYAGLEPGFRSRSALTIELLFPDEYVVSLLAHQPIVGATGATILQAITDNQKRAVAQAAESFPPEAFTAFEPILALLDRVLAMDSAPTAPSGERPLGF